MNEKTELNGGSAKTATWIWLENAQLKIEYFDFSEEAHRFFGNDSAHTLTMTEMGKLYSMSNRDEYSFIVWLAENFKSYFDIKKWLEENGISFRVGLESHALRRTS